MKKLSLVLFLCVHGPFSLIAQKTSNAPASSEHSLSAHDLKATVPSTGPESAQYHQQILAQADYFFDHLPQSELPSSITAEVQRVYLPLLELVSPSSPQQTQPQRKAQVLNHLLKFYGLLYLLAQEEILLKQTKSADSGKNAKLNTTTSVVPTKLEKPLTPLQLKESSTWQDHLKIMIASSYDQELLLLGKVHEHEKALFGYLPQFEVAYYQKSFEQVRKSTELTRLYLMLVDRMRTRFLADITRSADKESWGDLLNQINEASTRIKQTPVAQRGTLYTQLLHNKNSLFKLIQEFKKSDFYSITMRFEDLDWEKTTPVQFVDPKNNPITLSQVLSQGYNFGKLFHIQKNAAGAQEITITPHYLLMLEPTADGKEIVFTALGNMVFNGKIKYESVKTHDDKMLYRGSFETDALFEMLFKKSANEDSQDQVTPTLGYIELLSFMAIKLLHADLAELFTLRKTGTQSLDESDGGNLELTMQRLVTSDLPNFIAKTPDDYLILYEINKLQNYFAQEGIELDVIAQSCSAVKHFFIKLGHSIKSAAERFGDIVVSGAKAIGHAVEAAAKATWKAIKDAGKAIWHGMQAFGDEVVAMYYATCILPMIGGMSAHSAMKHAKEWQHASSKHFDQATKDMMSTVNDVADVVKASAAATASLLGGFVALVDRRLGSDVQKMWSSIADGIIDQFRDGADLFIEVNAATVQLTAEAIELATSVVGGMATGQLNGDLGAEFVGMAKDVAGAMLGYITLTIQQFTDGFKDAMVAVGYFISALTDAVEDACATVALLSYYGWKGLHDNSDFFSHYADVKDKIDEHRRLISGIITTTVLIAVTVATGGAATPLAAGMLAVNVGMMAMNIAGEAQGDFEIIDNKKRQHEFTQAYKEYVANNSSIVQGFRTQEIIEQLVQMQAETMNTERRLLYYQNYLNELFNAELSKKALSFALPLHDNTFINQETGVMHSDLGSLYGIQTGRMDLSPQGGFALYNQGRGTFSQEAAIEPLLVPGNVNQNALDPNEEQRTLWFLQKDLANIPAGQPLKADVLWRSLYEQDGPFYIGIYLSERSFDIQSLQSIYSQYSKALSPAQGSLSAVEFDAAWEKVDTLNRYLLNYDHLAKMFVMYRTDMPKDGQPNAAGTTPRLGVYVHESPDKAVGGQAAGWTSPSFKDISFKRNVWYRMQAKLEGIKLTVSFWEVGTDQQIAKVSQADTPPETAATATLSIPQATVPEAVAQLLVNQKNYSGSMGVITAGAAVEYKIIAPDIVAVPSPAGITQLSAPKPSAQRAAANKILTEQGITGSEQEREKASHKILKNPLPTPTKAPEKTAKDTPTYGIDSTAYDFNNYYGYGKNAQ